MMKEKSFSIEAVSAADLPLLQAYCQQPARTRIVKGA